MEPPPSGAGRSPTPRSRLRWHHLLLALGLLLYGILLAHSMRACAAGSDSSGYLNNARLLTEGRFALPMRLVPGLDPVALPAYAYVPLGFAPNADRVTMRPTYPVGLSLLLAAAAGVTGWDAAPGWVMGLHACAGLWLVYLLGRKAGLDPAWALVGPLMLAASPLYVFFSVQLMSDVPALVWVTAAVYLAWGSRERTWLAVAAGFALAIAVLIRPTNLLAAAPVAVALGFSRRRWGLALLGGLPGAVFLGIYNSITYGRVLTTGYGSVASEFSSGVAGSTLVHYAVWLPVLLSPLAILAVALPAFERPPRRLTALVGVWALVFAAFYAFDLHTHEFWWYLRFVLPAAPALIVAALWVAAALGARLDRSRRRWCLAAAAVLVVVNGAAWSRHFRILSVADAELAYPLTAAWLREQVPADAVVATMQTSGTLLYYTPHAFFRWDMITPADFERIARVCTAAGRPVYATLFPFEINDANQAAFSRHLPGRWVQVGAVRRVTIWRFEPAPAQPGTGGAAASEPRRPGTL